MEITRALTGNWREEHLFVLAQALAMYDSLAQRVAECDHKTEALLMPQGPSDGSAQARRQEHAAL